ncbi:hypothetical protein AOQ84DRAFT_375746 [Glonium stellatum]|uniref:Uncharacterized protein n=1 Tax=Glonium stellatum TaxID=574774 RepID=A0A8E2JUC1_9PEZI|nr:hypothetical protein AOQ84DRAFT_375746 [Glonium stellatum]
MTSCTPIAAGSSVEKRSTGIYIITTALRSGVLTANPDRSVTINPRSAGFDNTQRWIVTNNENEATYIFSNNGTGDILSAPSGLPYNPSPDTSAAAVIGPADPKSPFSQWIFGLSSNVTTS